MDAFRSAMDNGNGATMTGVRDSIEREPATIRDTTAALLSLGWPVHCTGRAVFLATTSGFCGLRVMSSVGEQMLRTLRKADAEGPVIEIPWPYASYVFLADADVVLDAAAVAQRGAALLQTPCAIPLPPSVTPRGRLTWIVPPRLANRWLPGLSTVRWALTMAG